MALAGIARGVAGSASRSLSGIGGGGAAGGLNTTASPIRQAGAFGPAGTAPTIRVEVVGTLRGAGKELVAVIEGQNYRRLRTN